jgi:hypothetical protein
VSVILGVEEGMNAGVVNTDSGDWSAGMDSVGAGIGVQVASRIAHNRNRKSKYGFMAMVWKWDVPSLFLWEWAIDTKGESGWECGLVE